MFASGAAAIQSHVGSQSELRREEVEMLIGRKESVWKVGGEAWEENMEGG